MNKTDKLARNHKYIYKLFVICYAIIFASTTSYLFISILKTSSCLQSYIIIFLTAIISFIINNFINKTFISNTHKEFIKKLYKTSSYKLNNVDVTYIIIFAIIFSLSIVFGNLDTLFSNNQGKSIVVLNSICIPAASLILWFEILRFFCKLSHTVNFKNHKKANTNKILLISWLIISIVYILNLVLINYPAIINADAAKQINQITINKYSNHYSFWVTQIMHLFIIVGKTFFSNSSMGILLFCMFQIIVLSLSFATILKTMKDIGIKTIFVVITAILFCIMPYHILMSNTLYTDTIFTSCIIFFTISVFRILKNFGSIKLNQVVLVFSGLGIGIFRPNGLYVILILTIIFLILFWKNKKLKLTKISLISVAVASIVLVNPVLDILNVEKTDVVDHISVPGQQICKVLFETEDITEDQKKLISNVADINKLKQNYNKNSFDNIKFYIKQYGNQNFIQSNVNEFLWMYVEQGLNHPWEYLKAWIDLTKDYWTPKSDILMMQGKTLTNYQTNNNYDGLDIAKNSFINYKTFFKNNLQTLQSIGFFLWILLIAFFMVLVKRDRTLIFIFIPSLLVVFSIIIAAPVQGEIRYVYPIFCLWPLFWTIALSYKTKKSIKGIK